VFLLEGEAGVGRATVARRAAPGRLCAGPNETAAAVPTIWAMAGGAWDTFVGRAAELDVLDAALTRAGAGDAAFVLVGGEPGIGKSTLIDRFASDARARGVRVVMGACWEAGGAPPYWPWVQIVRSVVRDADPHTVRALTAVGASDLAQMVPEVRDVLPDALERGDTDPETARFRLFDAVASFLRAVAARDHPLVITIDDAHAADTPSLLLLQFVARELRTAPIVLVVGYRSTEITRAHPLAPALAELTRVPNARRLTLEGFAPGEISEYLARVTGGDVDAAVVDALDARTDGNPLFVSELVRLIVADAAAARAPVRLPDEIPEGVQEAIARRVEVLSTRCRGVLDVAAVLGRDVPLDVLQALGTLDAVALLEAIDEAIGCGLLEKVGSATGDVRFSHVLVRDALYERLPVATRARTHLRAAEVIAHLRAHDLDPHLAEIAYHAIAAGPVADTAEAAQHAAVAGRAAARRLAYEEAIRLLQAAVELTERTTALDDTRLDLLLELGDARARAGDLAGAQETFRAAVHLARRRGRHDALAHAAIGYGGRFAWRRAGSDTELIALLEDALAAIGPEDSVLRVRLLSRLAGARRSELDPTRRRVEATEALAMARRLAEPAALASALAGFHGAIWDADTAHERLALAQEMIDSAERTGDTEALIVAYCARWVARWEVGDFAAARDDVVTCVPMASRLQQPAQRWLVAIGQAAVALFEGRFDEVADLARAGRREGRGSLQFDAESAYLTQMALLHLEQGRAGQVIDDVARGAQAYPWYPHLRCLLAGLYAADGQLDRASAQVRVLAPARFEAMYVAANYATFGFSMLADVVAQLGDLELAAVLHERLAPYAARNAMAPPEASAGWIARPLGVLSAALGRRDEAARFLDEALRAHREMGARPWLARTHLDYARLLDEVDAAGAAAHRQTAATIAESLGVAAPPQAHVYAGGAPEECVFRREGEYWTVAFGGRAVRLRHSKGLVYLAALLARPGHDIAAVDLAALGDRARHAATEEAGGEVLDARARREYRRRIEELQAELDEAEAWADTARAGRAREELDFLAQELAAASGLGGRARTFTSAAERARQRVKKAIAASLGRIDAVHPELGRHLASTVRTGFRCRYEPDPRALPTWRT
jgi:tetratricopeptide (TPR) repeat protein